jgi:hypothetical protein
MSDWINEYRQIVEKAFLRLSAVSDELASQPLSSGKWSPKEIIGHLIDSASNNHYRFVTAPVQENLIFHGYDQEHWVRAQQYSTADWNNLINLWRLYNLHLANVMENTSEESRLEAKSPHSLDRIAWKLVSPDKPATLEYMMTDYIGHLKNHLNQIFDGLGKLAD